MPVAPPSRRAEIPPMTGFRHSASFSNDHVMKSPRDRSDDVQGQGPEGAPADGLGSAAGPTAAPADATGDDAPVSGVADPVQRQLDEQREKYLRLAAEYDNFRKRAVRERQEAEQRGQANMVRGMLDALDDLWRFAHVDPTTTDSATLAQGVDMAEKKLLKTLAGHGLEIVNPVDQPFDPAVHEAVTTEAALSPEDDHMVSRVFQLGYTFNGQLLRPARVVVKQWNG
jgi:molecular chaperone GrpE